jgi:hypothetical protein
MIDADVARISAAWRKMYLEDALGIIEMLLLTENTNDVNI